MFDKYGNLTVIKGATLDEEVTYYEPDGITPIDLSLYEAVTRIKEKNIDSDELDVIILSTANGGMVLGGTLGTIKYLMSKEDTKDITVDEGVYDTFLILDSKEIPLIFNKKFYAVERV